MRIQSILPIANAWGTLLLASCVSATIMLLRQCHHPTLGPLHLHIVLFCSHAHNVLTCVPHSLSQAKSNLRSIQILRPISMDSSMEGINSLMKQRSRRFLDKQPRPVPCTDTKTKGYSYPPTSDGREVDHAERCAHHLGSTLVLFKRQRR